MEYTVEKIQTLAATARIAISDAEAAALCRELNAMRAGAEVLRCVADLPDPFFGAVGLDALREDTVREGLTRAEVLAISPAVSGDATVVPRAVEG